MSNAASYLRVIVNARCSLACTYCHQEGDPAGPAARGLDRPTLEALTRIGVRGGVRKLKFLGGEPLLRSDLSEVIAALRRADRTLDLSLITGGAVDPQHLEACFEAGLSRANLSIHGWSPEAFRERTRRGRAAWTLRQRNLELLLDRGRFLKLNVVWRSPSDDADIGALLAWAAGRPLVVNVLDDLGDPDAGPARLLGALLRLRGEPERSYTEPDPHSLPTTRLRWTDGLVVEIKDRRLGEVAPWRTCPACPARARCREGILALRLTHDGWLRPCMDRPEIGVDLRAVLAAHGESAARAAWRCAVDGWRRQVVPVSAPAHWRSAPGSAQRPAAAAR
jgi:molybdenum cofactor biosynthesis enzyme MoaA